MNTDGIVHVLSSLGIARSCIKSRGEWVTATCPFSPYTHSKGADRNASFGISVSPDGSSGYNCFSCGERGSLTMLPFKLSQFDGINRPELEEFIRETETPASFPPWELAGKKSKPVVEPISEIDFDIVFDPAYRKRIAVDYFKHRQIKRSFMREWDLRWDSYRKRVLFKVKRDGKLYGASGRSVLDNPTRRIRIYNHQKSQFLLGEERISNDTSKPVVVIEGLMGLGELDTLGLYDYADAVCIQGSKLSIAQRDRLVELDRHIVFMLDPDEAGYAGLYGTKSNPVGAVKSIEGLCSFHVVDWGSASDFLELSRKKLYQLVTKPVCF